MILVKQQLIRLNEPRNMIRHITLFILICIMWALSSGDAFAQNAAPAKSAQAQGSARSGPAKRTTINFEDQLIEGQAQKPELFYLLQQRNNNFKRLIRLRENFLPEMRKSSEDVGRASGSRGDN